MEKKSDPHWIEKATENKGALHRATDTPAGKDIPKKKLAHAEHSKNATERREANLAEELDHFRHAK